MKITQEADYALRIVMHLSQAGYDNRVDAKTISEQEGIPLRFTLKIVRKLTLAAITKAYRGVNGGYALNRPPQDITLKHVIEAIDGPVCVNRCTYDRNFCNLNRTNHCRIHGVLDDVRAHLAEKLDSINFKDLSQL